MRTFMRLTALVVTLSATGPSSALALCVASCPPDLRSDATSAEACHHAGDAAAVTIDRAGEGCSHTPDSTLDSGELARDERTNVAAAAPMMAGALQPRRGSQIAATTQPHTAPPSRTARSPFVLRI